MISHIHGTGTQAQNKSSTPTSHHANAGTIGKLQSEIQLIKSLSPIRLTGSEQVSYQGKPAQLLHAANSQNVPFNLINTGKPLGLPANSQATIQFSTPNQVSLTPPRHGSADAQQGASRSFNVNNLALASKVINLIVLSSSTQATRQGLQHSAQVTDGTNTMTLNTQHALQKGETVRAFVDNKNQLQMLPPPSQNSNALSIEALRQSLPKQLSAGDMAQLLKQLNTLQQGVANVPAPANAKVQQALSQLLQALPNLDTLTQSAGNMKQALQTSGQFSESLLKNNSPLINNDLKLNLARLNDSPLENGTTKPPSFPTEQIASTIERISTNQLRHFADSSQSNAQLFPMHIDLPIKEGQQNHLVQMDIDQDAATKDLPKEERRWLVKLKFDFEQTGRFDARLGLQGNKAGIVFAAEKADTQMMIKRHLEDLRQQLKNKDIEIERLDTFQGPVQDDKPSNPSHTSLIDVRT